MEYLIMFHNTKSSWCYFFFRWMHVQVLSANIFTFYRKCDQISLYYWFHCLLQRWHSACLGKCSVGVALSETMANFVGSGWQYNAMRWALEDVMARPLWIKPTRHLISVWLEMGWSGSRPVGNNFKSSLSNDNMRFCGVLFMISQHILRYADTESWHNVNFVVTGGPAATNKLPSWQLSVFSDNGLVSNCAIVIGHVSVPMNVFHVNL